MTEPVLKVSGVKAGYGEEDVLRGVSVEVRRGNIVAIIGPNGSGKSTLLKVIYGLVPAREGRVTLIDREGRERDLKGLRPNEITALGVNMVPQLANVFRKQRARKPEIVRCRSQRLPQQLSGARRTPAVAGHVA
jgi:ABC-type branched-subunit amino acid transport system ATPase component